MGNVFKMGNSIWIDVSCVVLSCHSHKYILRPLSPQTATSAPTPSPASSSSWPTSAPRSPPGYYSASAAAPESAPASSWRCSAPRPWSSPPCSAASSAPPCRSSSFRACGGCTPRGAFAGSRARSTAPRSCPGRGFGEPLGLNRASSNSRQTGVLGSLEGEGLLLLRRLHQRPIENDYMIESGLVKKRL